MKRAHLAFVAAAMSLLPFGALTAGEVKIEGVHICCRQCVNGAQAILGDVSGVTNGKADQDSSTITLTAADDSAAAAAIAALAKGGFRGTAKHGDKTLEFPAANVNKGEKADTVAIVGVHLCCPACYRAAEAALKQVAGVTEVTSDRASKTINCKGSGIEMAAALDALFKDGFHASVKK